MGPLLKRILSALPITTILGWIWPDVIAKYEAWQASKSTEHPSGTPESMLALGEAAANALASQFDPSLLPALEADEHIANPAAIAIIEAVEHPGAATAETAIIEGLTVVATIGHSKSTPEQIRQAALDVMGILNLEFGIPVTTGSETPAA